jgi:hypothetical protein
MKYNQEHFEKAVEYAANDLLHTWDALSKFDNYKEALEYTIYLGGGSSIHPNAGEFWFYERNKGFKITLLGNNAREISVPVKYFLSIAERIWNKEKLKVEQLSLF